MGTHTGASGRMSRPRRSHERVLHGGSRFIQGHGEREVGRCYDGGLAIRTTSLYSILQVLVKTHKEVGRMKCRAVHTSARHPMRPAMKLVSSTLGKQLRESWWLIRDSKDLSDRINDIRVPEDAKFIKVHIKEYFMSGRRSVLLEHSMKKIPDTCRSEMKRVLQVILENQYINIYEEDNAAYTVRYGSGMGLTCSGEVSDRTFEELVEIPFVTLSETYQENTIYYYGRFKDDVLTIMGGTFAKRLEFVRRVQK